jgi:hypothetical protein
VEFTGNLRHASDCSAHLLPHAATGREGLPSRSATMPRPREPVGGPDKRSQVCHGVFAGLKGKSQSESCNDSCEQYGGSALSRTGGMKMTVQYLKKTPWISSTPLNDN